MKRKIAYSIVLTALLLAVQPVRAQIEYQCDFEQLSENAQWVLNAGAAARVKLCPNHWYIGRVGNFSQNGANGLYISADADSSSASYKTSNPSCIVAYRTLTLPQGNYSLDFDWRALGNASTKLMVYWMPATQVVNSNNNGAHSTAIDTYQISGNLRASKNWNPAHISFSVNATTATGKLVFIWECAKDLGDPKTPAACVDNIIIAHAAPCNEPTKLNYDTKTMKLTWQGTASSYDVRDYSSNDNTLTEYDSVTVNSLTLALNTEGTHYFYVRSNCGNGAYSQWVSTSTFVWIPGMRCIDYLDFGTSNTNAGKCYTSTHQNSGSSGHLFEPWQVRKVDNGPSDAASMHTMHTDLNEIDPNTTVNGGLSTVPDGEIASVRLGAYTGSGEDARIEYKYTVLAGVSDLLDLKYAAVLNSGGHDVDNPFFQIEILDGAGNALDGCTQAYFVADMGETHSSWHLEGEDVYWCDWRTVTISLRPYVGQTLTIRLTSSRCVYDTHYGYAYFTLGCRSGNLEGLACGDFSTDHFDAPDGFTYRWYKEGQPKTTLGTDQTLHIANNDSSIYMVECHSTLNSECYYTLTANPNPRYPKAQVTYSQSSENCTNSVSFTNSSYVRVVNRMDSSTMAEDEPIYDIQYVYGDGKEETVSSTKNTHIYPETGGTFDAYCIALLTNSDGNAPCRDTVHYTITLPDMVHTGTNDTIHHCLGETASLPNGELISRDTVLTDFLPNKYGCDAPYNHYYIFHPTSYDSTVVELCEGGYVDFEGKRYDQSGRYRVDLQTQFGCDSILELMLTVIPRLEVSMPDTIDICGDDSLIYVPYSIIKGRVSAVSVTLDAEAQQRGFQPAYSFDPKDLIQIPTPVGLHPGYYNLHISLGTPDCPSDPVDVMLKVRYPSSVIDQKNDLIALLNADYNGGNYHWTTYQWYRNGELMPGSTTSYIVVSDADQNAEYYCVLTDEEGNTMATCPTIYTSAGTALANTEVLTVCPTMLSAGESLYLSRGGHISIFDTLGRLVKTADTPAGMPASLEAPLESGIYLVRVGQTAVRILVH